MGLGGRLRGDVHRGGKQLHRGDSRLFYCSLHRRLRALSGGIWCCCRRLGDWALRELGLHRLCIGGCAGGVQVEGGRVVGTLASFFVDITWAAPSRSMDLATAMASFQQLSQQSKPRFDCIMKFVSGPRQQPSWLPGSGLTDAPNSDQDSTSRLNFGQQLKTSFSSTVHWGCRRMGLSHIGPLRICGWDE